MAKSAGVLQRLWVSLKEEDRIACLNVTDGTVTKLSAVAMPGGPAACAIHPDQAVLFLALRSSKQLAALRINSPDCLTVLCKADLPSDPCFVSTDRTGEYVLTAYYMAGEIAMHRWDGENLVPLFREKTAPKAHAFQLDNENRNAYALHTEGNRIFRYHFDARTGCVHLDAQPPFTPGRALQPRHFCCHPTLPCLYVANEAGNSVSIFDRKDGALSLRGSVSSLPDTFGGLSLGAQIRITEDGRYLYMSNRGHNSIACYCVNEADGALRRIVNVPAPAWSRALQLKENHLYAAGEMDGQLAVYMIDMQTGVPRETDRVYIGKSPMWITVYPAKP